VVAVGGCPRPPCPLRPPDATRVAVGCFVLYPPREGARPDGRRLRGRARAQRV